MITHTLSSRLTMEDRTVQAPVHTHLEGRRDPTMKEVSLLASCCILVYIIYMLCICINMSMMMQFAALRDVYCSRGRFYQVSLIR